MSNDNPLRDVTNDKLFNMVRSDLSTNFQSRVPRATQGHLAETMTNLTKYRPLMNEFMDGLVNRIGTVLARADSMWNNPLATFKSAPLEYGSTIEEYQTGLLHAHIYDHDRESMEREVFGTEVPDMESNFHTVNREEKYKITVKDAILRRAFLEPGGLSVFVEKLMEAPIKSDNWDEFLLTCKLFGEYEANGGFYHMKIPAVGNFTSTTEDVKQAFRRMRALADTFTFLSTRYNAAHMPVHANPEDLVIFTTPEFKASIDVEGLAGAFNPEYMKNAGNIVTIPREYFGIDGCEAIITTRNFFVMADVIKENTSIYNPANLGNNYWLHHHEIISCSRFVPAVMFSTMKDDETITVAPKPAKITPIVFMANEDGTVPKNVTRGSIVGLESHLETDKGEQAGYGVTWSVEGETSGWTWITQTGVLHCGGDETADTLTVKAVSTYIDPADPHAKPLSTTVKVPVVGDRFPVWPADEGGDPKPPSDDPKPPSGESGGSRSAR